MNLATSWTDGTLIPTSSDVLIWNSTVVGANSVSTGGPLSAAGLKILNPGGLVTINSDATNTLTLGASGIDMSNATQNLTLSGAGSILSDAQSWTVAAGRTLTVNTNLNTGSISTLTIGGDGNTTIGAVISTTTNTTSITKNGGGTLTISGNQSTAGNRINNIALNAGTLAVNHQNAIQGTVTAAGDTTMNSNVGTFSNLNLTATGNVSINSGAATRYGIITGGANTLTFLTGTTKTRGASTMNGTTLDVRSGATAQMGDDQNNGWSSTSTITKIGAGTWTLQNGTLSATTGVVINEGILRNNNADRISNTTAVTIDGSTAVYDLQTFTESVGAVSLKNGGSITGTGTGAVSASSYSVESGSVSAILAGNGSLNKTTSGVATLTGANTYTGTTTVSNGTVIVSGSLSGTTNVAVNSGGTLLLSGAASSKINDTAATTLGGGKVEFSNTTPSLNEQVGALTLSTSSVIDFGTFSGGHTFRFADSTGATWSAGQTLSIWNWTAGVDHLFFGNTFGGGVTSSQLAQISFYSGANGAGFIGLAAYDAGGELSAIPEPSTTGLLGAIGLFGLIGFREFRRRRSVQPIAP